MATWQWSFPYNGSTAVVKFDAASADDTYHWRVPYQANEQPNQVYVETLDGGVRVYDLGSAPKLFVLQWGGIPEGSSSSATDMYGYLGIQEFLKTHTVWGKTAFGFEDHVGASEVKVRYVSGFQQFSRNAAGFYSGTIVLREELV